MKKNNPMTRSENMARVKSKNTKPENFLRKLLWHKGVRYRVNYKELPGSPDIYISISWQERLKEISKTMLNLKIWALQW